MDKLPVLISGATGLVGQRFVDRLSDHPFFQIVGLAASTKSAGRQYGELVKIETPHIANLTVCNATDLKAIRKTGARIIFCALSLDKEATRELETNYARRGLAVISNNSAHRGTSDVPVIIPEVNPDHLELIHLQRKRLQTNTGFIVCKPNCSLQPYVMPLDPLLPKFGLSDVKVATSQAVSGAGKRLADWPGMMGNVIPFIDGEEDKSEQEPRKIWGRRTSQGITANTDFNINAICTRAAVEDGHLAMVWATFRRPISPEEVMNIWKEHKPIPQKLGLPSAPDPVLVYLSDNDRPQPILDRDTGNGMTVSIGRLENVDQNTIRFVSLAHNRDRGAAGGAVLTAELCAACEYFSR